MESLTPRTRVDITVRLATMRGREPIRRGRKDVADVVVALHDSGDRCELCRAAVVEGVSVDSEQRTNPVERAERYGSGHDSGNIAVEHGEAGGDRTSLGASLQPSLELRGRHGSLC